MLTSIAFIRKLSSTQRFSILNLFHEMAVVKAQLEEEKALRQWYCDQIIELKDEVSLLKSRWRNSKIERGSPHLVNDEARRYGIILFSPFWALVCRRDRSASTFSLSL